MRNKIICSPITAWILLLSNGCRWNSLACFPTNSDNALRAWLTLHWTSMQVVLNLNGCSFKTSKSPSRHPLGVRCHHAHSSSLGSVPSNVRRHLWPSLGQFIRVEWKPRKAPLCNHTLRIASTVGLHQKSRLSTTSRSASTVFGSRERVIKTTVSTKSLKGTKVNYGRF